jgi:hypothetical protein
MAEQAPMELDEGTAGMAMITAMTVRNAMEGFHGDHLSDEQMAELNPIIRNAIATALYAMKHMDDDDRCDAFVEFQMEGIPDYWEPPVLLDDLTESTGARWSSILNRGD